MMTPSSSTSTPRSWIPPATAAASHSFKSASSSDRDDSYFSPKHSSPSGSSTNIPISTPLGLATSPSPTTSASNHHPHHHHHHHQQSPLGSHPTDPEMLQRLAKCFPAPPTLSLSSIPNPLRRPGASVTTPGPTPVDPSAPHISTSHRPAPPPGSGGGGAATMSIPSHSQESMPSPMDRSRRSPAPSYIPAMDISSLPGKHTFHVQLPQIIQPEMITISANKGDRLKVVADAWHMESDCHYEWQITFAPRDIDMTAIQARFEANGHLFIDVRRHAAGGSYVIGR